MPRAAQLYCRHGKLNRSYINNIPSVQKETEHNPGNVVHSPSRPISACNVNSFGEQKPLLLSHLSEEVTCILQGSRMSTFDVMNMGLGLSCITK